MNLLIVAALAAVCSAAKLDRTYLPPASAKTAGGSPGALQTPNSVSQLSAPKGSYMNEFQGVVVDAALAGTRASGSEETGLGAPRNSYGSTASKVGEAAFRGTQGGFRFPVSTQDNFGSANSRFGVSQDLDQTSQFGEAREIPPQAFDSRDTQGFAARGSRPERPQAAQDRAASTLRFDSEVGTESFNYAFETDNGISAEESGVATNGVQAQGGFSYTGDDGKVYTVTYTADEGGYQPRGDHLPTPPPIPEEILKSLEQNARDEANGVNDDGLYDAQKYNAGGDYAESDNANGKQNGRPSVNTGNTDVDASGTFINQNNLSFNPNNPRQRGDDKTMGQFQAPNSNGFQSNGATSNRFGSRNEYLPPFQQNRHQNSRPQIPTAEGTDVNSSSTFQQESTEEASGNFHSHSQQSQHTSARPSSHSRPSSNSHFNGFEQSSSNGNRFNQNGNRFPESQSQQQQQLGMAAVNPAFNNGENEFSAHSSGSFSSQHSTSIPDTELTTPFESNPQDTSSAQTSNNAFGFNTQPSRNGQSHFSSHGSHHQASQAPAQPTIPSFTQSRPQASNNRPFGGNRNTLSAFSTQAPQAPKQQEQLSQQTQFSQQSQFGNKRPQFIQSQFSQNTDSRFAPSTQRPQFAQTSAQDDSYYYNQPSRTFNTPQSQGSRFPSAPSNQFDRVTQRPSFYSETTQYSEEQNYPSTPFPSQNGQRQGSTRYPRPPSIATESTPSDNQFQANAISSATNGITQASASSFTAPTSATGFNRQQFGQSGQQSQHSSFQSNRPSSSAPSRSSFGAQTTAQPQDNRGQSQFEKQNFESAKPLSQQPLQDVKQPKLEDDTKPDVPVTNQQYNGEIYDYTKPAEMLPPPENGFGQFGQKVQSTQRPAQSQSQSIPSSSAPSQQATSESFEPKPTQSGQRAPQRNQFGSRPQSSQMTSSQFQQSSSSFESKPQFSQFGKAPQGDQFGAQTAQQSTEDQFDVKPARQHFSQSAQIQEQQPNNQRRPFGTQQQGSFAGSTAETPKPFGQNGRNCCKVGQFGQTQTSFGQASGPSQFGGSNSFSPNSFQSSSAFNQDQSQSVSGKGEIFGGPRAPPSFDETGYHY